MLISFIFNNVKTFSQKSELSMEASRKREHNARLMKFDNKNYLPSAMIYGPNASGKSNIIKSLNLLRQIILEGGIDESLSHVTENIELYPHFYKDFYKKPICFDVIFENNKTIYEYILEFYARLVPEEDEMNIQKGITKEKLLRNDRIVYERNENKLILGDHSRKKRKNCNIKNNNSVCDILQKNLIKTKLFLTNGFSSVVSKSIAVEVVDWFKNKLVILDNFNHSHIEIHTGKIGELSKGLFTTSELIKLSKIINIGEQKLVIKSNDKNTINVNQIMSIYPIDSIGIAVPSIISESQGTIKLLELLCPLIDAIKDGRLIIIDEIDESLHPEVVLGILDLFNNKDLNKNGAQLIATTHNLTLLSRDYLRRDQIYFIDKLDNSSDLYSLSDFPNVRNDADYLTNYKKGYYGAVPVIDFKPLFMQNEGV